VELRIAGGPLVSSVHKEMTQDERRFIVSVKEGKPQWDLLRVPVKGDKRDVGSKTTYYFEVFFHLGSEFL
jgi:hypothetical protein